MLEDFRKQLRSVDDKSLRFNQLETLQVNLGNRCNQSCLHCHVQAGPNGKKIMSKAVMEKIIVFIEKHPGLCIDITGGCPELNHEFRFFMENVYELASSIMIRTNLTVFLSRA